MSALRVSAVDYHTGGEPFRIVTGGVPPLEGATILDQRRDARDRLDHVPAPARLRAARPRRHVRLPRRRRRTTTAPTSASSSSTTRGTRPRAGTGRSRSSRGRSTRASSSAARARTASSSTCRRGASRRGRTVEDGRVRSVRFRNVPSFVWARGDRGGGPRRRRRLRRGVLRVASRSASSRGELPRLIELGRELKARDRGRARRRPPARAGAPRRLRRDLLAGGGRGAADAAQRDGVRRRRGRPLAVRLAGRRPGSRCSTRTGRLPRGAELRHLSHRRLRVHGPGRRRRRGRGRSRRRHRGRGLAPTGPAEPCSRSTRTTRSARASCSADHGTSMRASFRTVSTVNDGHDQDGRDDRRSRAERVVDAFGADRRPARGSTRACSGGR